ncbi:MAG: hypothetical protein MUE78_02440 [Ilumatobacteraceae bacterium]|jgi:hypothetical protein|nr:hypothetical protein [Ilumatobacteraceae bacterium]
MQPLDVIHTIAGPTGDIGAAFYFDPATLEVGQQLGLDGFRFYVLGRGGVLGDVEPDVVLAAFGYFEPGLVAKMWRSACEVMAPREAARAYVGCMATFGRARFADVPGLTAYCDAAERVIAATDPSALPLFAGLRAEPLPDDAPGRAAHLAMVLRELRGSAHLVAVRASGLRSEVAHAIKRPSDVGMFGWADAPAVTDDDRARHARAETLTDEILLPSFEVLDDTAGDALVAGTRAMHAALTS